METILFQAVGAAAFLVGTLAIGRGIRREPTKAAAERLSRVSHALYWGGLVAPGALAILYPGLTRLDGLIGLPSLPSFGLLRATGWLVFGLGMLLMVTSIRALKAIGAGLPAFQLSRQVVGRDIYQHMRNPMSLGYYLCALGGSLGVGSSYLLLMSVLVIIPVHLFNLVYFEEHELRARHGESYEAYRTRVPLLLPRVS
jgi:protein-S-isoprenylcysteine O-methyltransferase Ste14